MSDEQSPMSDADLAEVETRLEALAPIPAPWEAWEHEGDTQIGADAGQFVAHIGRSSWPNTPITAELIANAPTDLRRLLDEVHRLRGRDKWLQVQHDRTVNQMHAANTSALRELQALATVDDLEAELAAARSECAALAAKVAELEGGARLVQARAAGWDEGYEAGCESDPDSLIPGNNPYRTAPDTAMDPFEAADDTDRRWE
jgi:hypothetical protein